jgi:hypothetical protein
VSVKRGAVGSFVVAAGLVLAPLSTSPALADTTTPSWVQIDTPAPGPVSGLVDVNVTALADTADGMALSMQLLVDGAAYPGAHGCSTPASPGNTTSPYSCQVVIPWDATELSGTHQLVAELTTNLGNKIDSPAVSVQVNNPAPTIQLVSPASAYVTAGTVVLKAVGSIAGGQTDTGAGIEFLLDGNLAGASSCAVNGSCTGTYIWNASHVSGAHTLQVKFVTRDGRSAVTPVQTLHLVHPVDVTLDKINPVAAGTAGTVTGTVTATDTNAPAAGAPVTLTFTPVGGGTSSTVHTTTGTNGTFHVSWTTKSNTTVAATAGGDTNWAAATAVPALLQVEAPVSCTLTHSRIAHGKYDTITCKSPATPNGTGTVLQYRAAGGKWVVLAKPVLNAGKFTRTFKISKKGSYQMAVLISTTRTFDGGYDQVALKVT